MDETEVLAAVEAELSRAESFMESRIARERALAYDYYYGREFGNEVEGRSRVVSGDVAQVVDSAVPALLKVFVSGDKAVEFTPRGPEDVESAEQATVSANYVFFTQNNGYALAHDFLKDGLLQKTGAFKWRWDTSVTVSEKRYQGLDEQALAILSQSPDVEIVAHSAYPNPEGVPGPDGPLMLHDVTVRQKKESGRVKIIVPPCEEILISPDSMSLDVMEMPFLAHTPLLTASDLREMGIEQAVIDTLPMGDEDPNSDERIARRDRTDASARLLDSQDRGSEYYRYEECYLRLDEDGDGVAELRKVCKVGSTILHDEPVDHIPIAIWTPKVMPHEVVGISLADDVMDLQLLKSAIWRQVLDNLYLSNAPRVFVQGNVNLDDLLSVKPGGVVRGEPGSAVTPLPVPFMAQHGYTMLEYIDQEEEVRTGVSRLFQGIDPQSINKTATGVNALINQANARVELIARNAAEFGFKPLFKGILYLLAKHQQQALMVRLTNKFVPVDPETWSKEYDMSCNVGLGTGTKDQQLMHLQALGMMTAQIGQSPFGPLLLDAKKVYNQFEKVSNLMGFKDASIFLNDPVGPDGQVMQPPPNKPEAVQVAEIKAQTEQQSAQSEGQAKAMEMQAEGAFKAQELQADAALKRFEIEQDMALKRYEMEQEKQLEIFKARLAANVQLQTAAMQPETDADGNVTRERRAPQIRDDGEISLPDDMVAMGLGSLVESLAALNVQLSRPKRIVRDPVSGRAAGIE